MNEAWEKVKKYAKSQRTVNKVVGDYAFQTKNGSRLIRMKCTKNGKVIVYDSKKGIIEL